MNDKTSKARRSKVVVKPRRNGTNRLELSYVHEDQLDLIQTAFKLARIETGTEYDAVALTNICLYFVATFEGSISGCRPTIESLTT